MTLVSEHAKRVIVIHNGAVLYDGSTRGFFSDKKLLDESCIIPPMAVRLSHDYLKLDNSAPCMMNTKEWVNAIKQKQSS
ncbi:MAG TPA: hypothetical protein VMD05_03200 [Candidatus Nanoarchaeia archaeon]|nr:hypothetical protein [Candidatus Nanoarchaeia archaeon]